MVSRFLCIAILWSALNVSLPAQDSQRVTLNGTGYHTVTVKPQRVRILIPLIAHSLSTDEAIELLRERKDEARQRVLALGGLEPTLRFGSVAMEDVQSLNGNTMSTIRMMNGLGNDGVDLDELPIIHTARADMLIDWQLPNADEEAILSFVEQLVSKLKDPDITGKDIRPEFSPKVEEALKAIRNQSNQYVYNANRQNPDAIRYLFVASVDRELMQTAVKGAVEDAKLQITTLCDAAGYSLGRLLSMNQSHNHRWANQSMSSSLGNRARPDLLVPQEDEVASPFVGDLKMMAQVQVHYAIEP